MYGNITTKELALPGVFSVEPTIFRDTRGFFAEIYNYETFSAQGMDARFVQDSLSYSVRGVIRGMHLQRAPHAQTKLVRCVYGNMLDIVVDIDPRSETYRQYVAIELSGETQSMLYIPGQYAHGFCVTSDEAVLAYKLSDGYHPDSADGFLYNDPELALPWPIQNPILSDKDRQWGPIATRGGHQG